MRGGRRKYRKAGWMGKKKRVRRRQGQEEGREEERKRGGYQFIMIPKSATDAIKHVTFCLRKSFSSLNFREHCTIFRVAMA